MTAVAINERAAQWLADAEARLPDFAPSPSGRVRAFDGVLMEATGLDAPTGTLCQIEATGSDTIDGEIIGFRNDRALLMSLDAGGYVRPGARVKKISTDPSVRVGDELLGRVIDGRGRSIDGGSQPVPAARWPLRGPRRNALQNESVTEALDVGVRSINAALTIGKGQRIGIVAGSGVGKSVLLGMLARYTSADIVVIALIGERGREVSDFCREHLVGESATRTVVVAVPADQSPVLRLRGAERATAIAEYYRDQGKSVLLILDSLTRVAHAQREIGLALGEPPTSKGYPPSVFSLVPKLVERAGAAPGGGSITAIYTVLADGDDVEGDPVVDSARAILDGHIVLSRQIAERGLYPAIDLSRSVSRTMQDVVRPAHMKRAMALRRANGVYEQNADLVTLGAYKPGQNVELDEAMQRRPLFEAFMAQSRDERVDYAGAIADLETLMAPR
ncbi:FliI/YscN family ATPase [Pacificimonas sp. ICDLI1SI03]